MNDETIDIGTGLFLIGGVADEPKRCGRQDPPPKAAKELPQLPDTAVGGMARSAINKAEGVETTLGEAGDRTAKTSKEGTPYARDLELMAMADEFFTACYDSIGAIEELYL